MVRLALLGLKNQIFLILAGSSSPIHQNLYCWNQWIYIVTHRIIYVLHRPLQKRNPTSFVLLCLHSCSNPTTTIGCTSHRLRCRSWRFAFWRPKSVAAQREHKFHRRTPRVRLMERSSMRGSILEIEFLWSHHNIKLPDYIMLHVMHERCRTVQGLTAAWCCNVVMRVRLQQGVQQGLESQREYESWRETAHNEGTNHSESTNHGEKQHTTRVRITASGRTEFAGIFGGDPRAP